MDMEEKHNPNSDDRLKQQSPSNSLSELPPDLLISVFKRLNFANFQRAKSVCLSWHSASRHSVPENHIPWLILFPEEDDNTENSCTLFNLEEKDKIYKTQDLGLDFAKSVCIATYESWLLMQDPLCNLYVMNLFTKEKIDLPPVESLLGNTKLERITANMFHITNDRGKREESEGIGIRSPVFWIDEITKDYVVIWGLKGFCVVYAKKGDEMWKQIPSITGCYHMVYKDHKLYFASRGNVKRYLASRENVFRIFDFSGDIPQLTFESSIRVYVHDIVPLSREPKNHYCNVTTKFVVRVNGDVLGVEKRFWLGSKLWSFHVYKVYSSEVFNKDEKVDSLGDEAILLDLGITVLANDDEVLKRNTIYYNGVFDDTTIMFHFNLETQNLDTLHKFDNSSVPFSRARWFLPSFKTKCF